MAAGDSEPRSSRQALNALFGIAVAGDPRARPGGRARPARRAQPRPRRAGDGRRLLRLRRAGARAGPTSPRCRSPSRSAACSAGRVERWLVRPLYQRPFDTLVVTWGLSLLLRKSAEAMFGLGYKSLNEPVGGTVERAGRELPALSPAADRRSASSCWARSSSGTGAAAPARASRRWSATPIWRAPRHPGAALRVRHLRRRHLPRRRSPAC